MLLLYEKERERNVETRMKPGRGAHLGVFLSWLFFFPLPLGEDMKRLNIAIWWKKLGGKGVRNGGN